MTRTHGCKLHWLEIGRGRAAGIARYMLTGAPYLLLSLGYETTATTYLFQVFDGKNKSFKFLERFEIQ